MVEGFGDFEKRIDELVLHHKASAQRAVRDVAEEFASVLKRNTPRSEDGGVSGPHLKDDVQISGVKGSLEGNPTVDIGYGKQTGWRSKFPDKGTVRQPAQNFTEKTIQEMTPKALMKYKEALRVKG